MPPDSPSGSDPGCLKRIRAALETHDYDARTIGALLGGDSLRAFARGWRGPVLRQTNGGSCFETLVRLFALGLDVPEDNLAQVAETTVADWADTRLLQVRRGVVHPLVAIHAGEIGGQRFFVVSDSGRAGSLNPLFPEFVIDVDASSVQLAAMTLRRPFERALDLGTGNGFQAIIASTHCREVIATDVNSRALAFAAFNLVFNGITNVELRLGDLYKSVEHDQFDLIVSNPPFVVSPSLDYYFRDNPLPKDDMSKAVVQGAAEHLNPGGWSHAKCHWVHLDGEDWRTRIQRWGEGTACDMLALTVRTMDPLAYALQWQGELVSSKPDEADQRLEKWMRYFDAEGITAISEGFITLHKTTAHAPWFVTDELSHDMANDRVEAIPDLFGAQDWLEDHSSTDQLLAARFQLPQSVQLQTAFRAQGSRWIEDGVVLYKAGGLHANIRLSDPAAHVITACDGIASLQHLFDLAVQRQGLSVTLLDSRYTNVRADFDVLVRRLVRTGFLQPAKD